MNSAIELKEAGVWYKKKAPALRTEKFWGLRNISLEIKYRGNFGCNRREWCW